MILRRIADLFRSMPDYIGSAGRSSEEIEQAENLLKCKFAEDYREYLAEIGLACFDGHELTGLTTEERLNVVSVTQAQRSLFGEAFSSRYVVEETNIDGIVIWQDAAGAVYETASPAYVKKAADSLSEYYTPQETA